MQKTSVLQLRAAAISTLIISGLMGSAPLARAADSGSLTTCSDKILYGDYGLTIEGVLALPGQTLINGGGLPLRGVVMRRYDGKGNLTQSDHVVVNGMPPALDWTAGTGTYTVNPDCTGTAVINSPSNPTGPLALHFVVVKQGSETHEVVDNNAVTTIGVRVE
jgi:hypothetical protein